MISTHKEWFLTAKDKWLDAYIQASENQHKISGAVMYENQRRLEFETVRRNAAVSAQRGRFLLFFPLILHLVTVYCETSGTMLIV